MNSLLSQLDNDEAILLMYIADELPMQDRALIEQRLSTEESLRAQLHSMRGLQDTAFTSIRATDPHRLPAGHGAGSRRVVRAMQKWQTSRELERAAQPKAERNRLRIPGWTYPAAAAAMLIIGFVIWGMNVDQKAPSDNGSGGWTENTGSIFDAPPADPASPIAEQYAKLEETLDDSANLTIVDDQVNSLSDWGSPIFPKDVVDQ